MVDVRLYCYIGNYPHRAKRALESLQKNKDGPSSGLSDNYGMVLVPLVRREKRSVAQEDDSGLNDKMPKYKRLSHSVHVQSDIRYR